VAAPRPRQSDALLLRGARAHGRDLRAAAHRAALAVRPRHSGFVLTLLQDFLSDEAIFHGFHKHWLLPMGIFVVLAVLLLPRGIGGLRLRHPAPEIADD
jgi:hypothetical protein